ncbi:MAG: LacI family DNA-binding transcriptional regulator [Clostridia bacterium]|jgi:LacI family transcriptional regulator|nr:LacI family DNA-binding transcriptional regulator [Clostridia bacterium]MBR3037132.1 LacI family DNA-binding transcriptional regulator [Clostridia bacterium]
MQKSVSIKEISEQAGVSIATVSRVINKNGRYSKETEERVLRVIAENNYQPNLVAKGLRVKHMKNVGILVPDIKNEFFTKLIYEIERNLFAAGYETFVCNTDEDEAIERHHVQMMQMQRVCGLVFISGTAHELTAQVPTVLIDRISTDPAFGGCMITSDNVEGGYLATRELLEQGARRILFMTSSKQVSCYEERYAGYCKALKEFGLPDTERRIATLDVLNYEGAKAKMKELLAAGSDVDGVFAGSDWLALGCYKALCEYGRRIPEDVRIAGYDDISITAFNAIPITTVHQQVDEMGRLVAERLIAAMKGEKPDGNPIRVPVYLVPRKSTRG